MGNSAGTLNIKLDPHGAAQRQGGEAVYIAGDTVKGSVSIDFQAVESRFPGKPLDFKIILEISGKEKSKICQGQIARKSERILLYNQTLLHHVTPDQVWNGMVDFGFSLEIPASMPSSFRCDSPGRSYAEISYKLGAIMELTDPSSTAASLRSSISRTKKERIISIRARPIPPIVVPWMMQPTSHPIRAFGITSKGFIICGFLVNDTHVAPGETLTISFACRNQSTVDVQKMYVKLVETVSWVLDSTKQIKSVERVLHQQEETMHVPQQQSRDLWFQESIGGVTKAEDDFVALYNDLKNQKQVLRVKVPAGDTTNDAYAGPLVKCTHHLEIRIKTENHVDDPRVQVPLQFKQFQTCSHSHSLLRKQSMMVAPRARRCPDESENTSLANSTASQEIPILAERQSHADIYVPSFGEHNGNDVTAAVGEKEDTAFRSALRNLNFTAASSIPATQESTTRDVTNDSTAGASSLPDTRESTTDNTANLSEGKKKSTLLTQVEIPLSQIRTGGRIRVVRTSADSGSDSLLSQTSWFDSSLHSEFSKELQAVLPSFENLLQEMLFSVDDFDIVCSKLEDPEWRPIFFRMSPDEFGSMLAHVNMDHDQPKVAAIVAAQISMESSFTCQHVIHALRNADWTRASIMQRLLPFCCDLLESKELLKQELTPWELTVLAGDLEKAICNRLKYRPCGGGRVVVVRSSGCG